MTNKDQEREQAEKRAAQGDARGYSWPPFEQGNLAAVRHGGYSEQLVERDTEQVMAAAFEVVPWLSAPEFAATVRSWARAEAVAARMFTALSERMREGDIPGGRDSLFERWRAAENLARNLRADLGLDPKSRMALEERFSHVKRDEAIAALVAEGRSIREARGLSEHSDDDEEESDDAR